MTTLACEEASMFEALFGLIAVTAILILGFAALVWLIKKIDEEEM